MKKVSIILVDWNGYKLRRKKNLGKNVIHCGLGKLLENINNVKSGVPFDLYLIINTNEEDKPRWYDRYLPAQGNRNTPRETYLKLKEKYNFIEDVYFRDNVGMDIGAYNYGIELLKSNNSEGDVLFMNSSVRGPENENWLKNYQKLFNSSPETGLCGISLNSHNTNFHERVFMPHLQSFFLYTSMDVIRKLFNNGFPGSSITSDKIGLIHEGEIGISQVVLDAGLGIVSSAFPEFNYQKGDEWTIPEGDIRYKKEFSEFANNIRL